jgi:predicted thioesterase
VLPAPADGAAEALAGALRAGAEPHPAAPPVGASTVTVFPVTADDTAASMGHPDPDVTVVGSPRLGLWFELATSPLMPPPGSGVRHVGVGLVVHHVGTAEIGEDVSVEARVLEATGRAVVFTLEATAGGRCVARGVHHRRILDV